MTDRASHDTVPATTGSTNVGPATTGPATTGSATTGSATTGSATTGSATTGTVSGGGSPSGTGSDPSPGSAVVTADRRRLPAGPVLLAAATTAGWAAVVSFAPVLVTVLLVWQISGVDAATGDTVRFALAGWLLGHGVPVETATGDVSLTPLLLTALVGWRLVRAGGHTVRALGRVPNPVPVAVGAVTVSYAVLASLAALVAGTTAWQVSLPRAFLTTGVLAGLASLSGALAEQGTGRRLWRRLPPAARAGLWSGTTAVLLVLAAGALLAAVATVTSHAEITELYRSYRPGPGDVLGLTLVCLLYAPTLAVWSASYLVGPGFAFGTGTRVDVFDVALGPLPALPSLGALPVEPAGSVAGLLIGVPLLAGMVVGVSAVRRDPGAPVGLIVGGGLLCAPAAGLLFATAALLARGALGDGQLARIGPHPFWVGLLGAGLTTAGAVIAALGTRALASRS